jgi:DNA-binding GntR family transcriptional regulator
MLQREGLVRLHPQRGAVVFLPDVDDLREHYEIRAALEALAAAKVAERFAPEWAEPLRACLDEMREAPPAERYIALNQRFHTALYAHSGRPRLVEMIAALRDASSAYLHIYRAADDFPVERLDAEHREILAACLARDPERAARAVRDHLRHTVEHVAERL